MAVAEVGGAQLLERGLFDLADALGADAELAAQLTKRASRPAEAVASCDHALLAVVQAVEQPTDDV
ncbi:MAG TPA: hypothetical protein VGD00_06690 [Solirubrobacteraceae bacterium]